MGGWNVILGATLAAIFVVAIVGAGVVGWLWADIFLHWRKQRRLARAAEIALQRRAQTIFHDAEGRN